MEKIALDANLIEGFASSLLTEFLDSPSKFGWFHKEWWELATSKEKFVAICSPRGHAKSTIITIIYTLTALLFRDRKYALLVADTEGQASLFLGQIKQILYDSTEIQDLFGLAKKESGEVDFEKDTETDIVVKFADGGRFRIMAKGAEQKLRGLLWDGKRPDLIVIDDLLNEELVANKDRRDKLRRWVYGSLIPCRSRNGIIRWVGTPMNLDDPLESLMPKENSKHTKVEDLKISSVKKIGAWLTVKYRAHNEDMSELLWKERYDKQYFKELRDDFMAQGIPEVYSCEYLCNPVDDSIRFFKKSDFNALREEDRTKDLVYYVAADLAISQADRADWSVIAVAGMDADGIMHVKNVIRDRMDGLQIVDTFLQVQRLYNPLVFAVEEGQISKSIGPFLNRAMVEQNTFINLLPIKPHRTDKITRARSIQARMRAGAVKFDKSADWYEAFENELMTFPRSKHDDCVDAMSYLGLTVDKMVEGRTSSEVEEEEYDEEVEASGTNELGRSAMCGY